MNLFTYSGDQPVVIKNENEALILKIIKQQLEIIERITQEKWLVHSGSKIVKSDVKL